MAYQLARRPFVTSLLLIAGTISTTSLIPTARADIVDTFDTGNAGWGLINESGFGPAPWQATGGNPDGHLRSINFTPPAISGYFTAPARYAGNQSAATSLRFDMQRSATGPIPAGPDILLRSGYADLSRKLPSAPGTGWTSYNLSLTDPTGWFVASGPSSVRPAMPIDMRSALSRMTGMTPGGPIYLRSEWNTQPGESGALDNVRLVGGAVGGAKLPPGLFNIDVLNVSPKSAQGLRIVLPGDAKFSRLYTGQPAVFDKTDLIPPDPAPPAGDPGLQSIWYHSSFGETGPSVDPGETYHPGFTLSNQNGAYLADMYWTDAHGNATENGHIHVASTDLIYNPATGEASLNLTNTLADIATSGISVEEMTMYLRPTPFDLAELNRDNAELAAGLTPIPGAASSVILSGGVFNTPLPGTYTDGQSLIFRYKTSSPTTGGELLYYAQFTIPTPGTTHIAALLAISTTHRRRRRR